MTRAPYKFPIEALGLAAAVLLSPACSDPKAEKAPLPLSDKEIVVDLSEGWTPMVQSRAGLFDKDALLDPGKGGRNITLYAYVHETGDTFLGGAHAWFFPDPTVLRWIFLDSSDKQITYYWPNSNKLDFFGYMPDKRYEGKALYGPDKYHAGETYIKTPPVYKEGGPTVSCDLPAKVSNAPADRITPGFVANSDIQEFIYAYEPDKLKADNPVNLQFKHPLALINFELGTGSYRMKIDSIRLTCIHRAGTFSAKAAHEAGAAVGADAWTPSDVLQPNAADPTMGTPFFTMEIQKDIPKDENYNAPLGDPFLVLPQLLDKEKLLLTLYGSRGDVGSLVEIEATAPLIPSGAAAYKWKPGRQYTYTIHFGDNNEEIYFNVTDTEWIPSGETDIEVE